MFLVVTAEKLVQPLCLRAETVYTKVRAIRQPLLAFVSTVQYLSLGRLFSVKEHQRF